MEHSVDLAAKTFVQAVSPSSSLKILNGGDEETGDGGEDDEVDTADSVGKALLLVKQVCPVL